MVCAKKEYVRAIQHRRSAAHQTTLLQKFYAVMTMVKLLLSKPSKATSFSSQSYPNGWFQPFFGSEQAHAILMCAAVCSVSAILQFGCTFYKCALHRNNMLHIVAFRP